MADEREQAEAGDISGDRTTDGPSREPSKGKALFGGADDAESGGKERTPAARAVSEPGWFGVPFLFAVGLTSLGAAVALAAVHAQRRIRGGSDESLMSVGVWALVWGVVGSLIGFGAIRCVASYHHRAVGDARLAAARMFAATGLFMLVANMGFAPTGWTMVDRPVSLGLATLVYLAVVWASFRLPRDLVMSVLYTHAIAWIVVFGAARWAPALWRGEARAATTESPRFEPPDVPAAPAEEPRPIGDGSAPTPIEQPPVSGAVLP